MLPILATIGAGLAKVGAGVATGAKTLSGGLAKMGTGAKTLGSAIGNSKMGQVFKTGVDNTKTILSNAQDRYNNLSDDQKKFMNELLTSNNTSTSDNSYQPTLINADYSPYIGYSPITQQYLNGRY